MQIFRRLLNFVPVFLLFISLVVLWNILQDYSINELKKEIAYISWPQIYSAFILVVINYLIFGFYDYLAFKHLKLDTQYYRILFTSFLSYSFSQTIGFGLLSGGAIRHRCYSRWGVSSKNIAIIILFSSIHFWLGLIAVTGVACLNFSSSLSALSIFSERLIFIIGIVSLLIVSVYLYACSKYENKISLFGYTLRLPSLLMASLTIFVAMIDWIIAASIFYVLLPLPHSTDWLNCVVAFLFAQLVSVISHVPGGVGVFESIILNLLGHEHRDTALMGSLVLFRTIYYLFPFLIGGLVFAIYEVFKKRVIIQNLTGPIVRILQSFIPFIITYWVFISGLILLLSTATPTAPDRVWWLNSIPIPVIELAHFTNSIIGTILVVAAFGLRRRTKSSFRITRILLLAGVFTSILKGLDWEEALIVGLAAFFLQLSRSYFYRVGSGFSGLTIKEKILSFCALFGFIWLGFFSYKHIEYDHSLWWQFTFESDASRFLRSSVFSACAILCLFIWKLSHTVKPKLDLPTQPEIDEAHEVIMKCSLSSDANLALLGDKYFLWNESRTGFLMYAIQGNSWIVYGEPIAEDLESKNDLIWQFLEKADFHGGTCCFYQVPSEDLYIYVDAGLKPYRIGEHALVELEDFSLEGSKSKTFRNTLKKLTEAGYIFKILDAKEGTLRIEELKKVSDDWLESKNAREKGFSLGFFDKDYLSRCAIAVIEKEGNILAFCNLIESTKKFEISVDLMRYLDESPNGTMDFIFLNLFIWGKENGYKYFNLGMAPLAGFVDHRLAPFWFRFASLLYDNAGMFYNFEGVWNYKNKFHPKWEPRYVLIQGEYSFGKVMTNITTLISRGVLGVVAK